ncbi:MAG: c-type cytochrome [Cytophagales bacterium]|nr:c-type cytochrome [Cytophagales bacterium]
MSYIRKYIQVYLMLFAAILPVSGLLAQSESMSDNEILILSILGLTTLVSFLVLVAVLFTYRVTSLLLRKEREKEAEAKGVELAPAPTFWGQIKQSLTKAVPIEKEADIMLDHNYDGIKELDNHLPPWWTGLFYVTIAFAVFYIATYTIMEIFPTQEQEYNMAMDKAKAEMEARNTIDENTVEFSDDAAVLASGEEIYIANCKACHGAAGEGTIGPNLTDKYWIHGGSIKEIFKTIKVGVPAKGMIPWQTKLSPNQMRDVASFILTMQGTNPANGKAPEGTLVE